MTKKKPKGAPSAYERNTFSLLHELIDDSEYWGWFRDQGTGSSVTLAARHQAQSKDAMLERIEQLHAMRRELLALRKKVREMAKWTPAEDALVKLVVDHLTEHGLCVYGPYANLDTGLVYASGQQDYLPGDVLRYLELKKAGKLIYEPT